jgi:hypothetical protein
MSSSDDARQLPPVINSHGQPAGETRKGGARTLEWAVAATICERIDAPERRLWPALGTPRIAEHREGYRDAGY